MTLRPRISRAPSGIAAAPLRPQLERSQKHLANVRACGCCICGKPAEAHHLMSADFGKAMARKSADRWCIPLCPRHHANGPRNDCAQYAPGGDEAWLAAKGIDARALAAALWRHKDEPERMQSVVAKVRLAALTVRREP